MNLIADNIDFRLFSELLQQFDPEAKITQNNEDQPDTVSIIRNENAIIVKDNDGIITITPKASFSNVMKFEHEKLAFYNYLRRRYQKDLNWGILTGVKPVKLYKKLESNHFDPIPVLRDQWKLKQNKIDLLKEVHRNQIKLLNQYNKEGHVSLYIGIPICFSKCTYCSFITTISDKKRKTVKSYLVNLLNEIRETGQFLKEKDIIIDSIYIGGGTPSILEADELEALLETIKQSFDLKNLQEYTFESGRPETTTKDRLKILKKYDINRICLNPQTMNDNTLNKINRHYSSEDILEVFKTLREEGFNNINMDLISGLEDETEEDFLRSLNKLISLDPEGITVHDLSIKKGSKLKELNGVKPKEAFSDEFYDKVNAILDQNGYKPYYMYRQKYTVGNGENIGYAKKGFESLYNVLMMAEEQTILGLGAGSSGKLYDHLIDQFNKVFTVKDINTYNIRNQEIIEKKINQYSDYFKRIG